MKVSGMPPTVYDSTPSVVFGGVFGSALGEFMSPQSAAFHYLTDTMYVVDYMNNRVCEFTSGGGVISCMSGYMVGDDTVPFQSPLDVSVADGRIVVADEHRVMFMYTNSTLIHIWGSLAWGVQIGEFFSPQCVILDGDLIYVVDERIVRIQVLNVTNPSHIDVIHVKVDGLSFSFASFAALDPVSGDIYVVAGNYDSQDDLLIIYNRTGHYVCHYTATDLGAHADLGQIALYRGQMYVRDHDCDCIHILSYNGSYVQRLGVDGTCDGCFRNVYGIAVHRVSGNLIATDRSNHNAQIFIPQQ